MIIAFDKLYKKYGIRRIEHFMKPRVLSANNFSFPLNSSFHTWKLSHKAEYFTRDAGYYNDVSKAQVRTILKYDENNLVGKTMEKVFVVNKFITENAKLVKEYKFLKPDQELNANDKILRINNYGALNECYKYQTQPLLQYNQFANMFNSIIYNLFIDNGRSNVFILAEIPSTILKRNEYDRLAKGLRPAHMDLFQDYRGFIILELWKFLSPNYYSSSLFSKIPKNKYKNVNLLFSLDNKVLLLNMEALAGCVSELGVSFENIKPKKADSFRKMFYVMLEEFIATPAMTDQELENLENNLNTNPEKTISTQRDNQVVKMVEPENNLSIKENNVINQAVNVTNQKPTPKFTSISDMVGKLRNLNEGPVTKVREDEEEDYLDNAIDDVLKRMEEKESDELYDSLIDEIEKNEIQENVTDDDWQEQDKEEPTLLDKKINQTEIEISDDDINVKTLAELESEVYNYHNVIDKIDYLKENKVLDKKNATKMKDILEKQAKTKDPYKSNQTIEEMLDDEKDKLDLDLDKISISDNKVVFDQSYNNDTSNVLRKQYLQNQYHKDIIRCVYSLQNGKIIVENYNIDTIEDALGTLEEHSLTLRTLDNKTHNIKFYLPLIKENGEITINNQNYMQRFQRNNLPISKLSREEVKLSSYYGKLFVSKAAYKKDDIGYFIMGQLAKRYESGGDIKDLIMLPSKNEEVQLPLDYSHFSRYVKAFKFKDYQFNFEYKNRAKLFKDLEPETLDTLENDKSCVLTGHRKGTPIVMGEDGTLYEYNKGDYKDIGDMFELLDISRDIAPIEFSVIKIFKKQIPTVLLLSYYLGLTNLLKTLEMKFELVEPKQRATTDFNQIVIKFQDKKLIITRDHNLGDMILGGLLSIQKILKDLPYKVLNDKNSFSVLCNKLEYTILYINEIKNMESLFVDPITLTILKGANLPTSFKGLLMKANDLLLDDNYTNPNNIKSMAIKGYERIAGMIYTNLTKAVREYDGKSAFSRAKLSMNPYTIIQAIQEDSTTVLVDDLNPVASIKQTEDVSYLGQLGFNKETLVRQSRIFNESEVGVISEAVKDSGDVGITAYMTAAPKIENLRGTIGDYDEKKDGVATTFSTSALLSPFGLQDDGKRLNFASIHNAHVIPINTMRAPYVRTGYEAIIPIRAGERFVTVAEDKGVVTKVTPSQVEVEYGKNKNKKTYKYKNWTTKEESDACYTHVMVPNVQEGDKVEKDDTLIYDKLFFEPDIFNPKRVIYKQGDLITVALTEDLETYEDSASISSRLNQELGAVVTKVKSIIIEAGDNVMDLVKVGDKVDTNDALFSKLTSMVTPENLDKRTIELLKNLRTQTPKAKVRGTISKIVVRYNCDYKELSKTLREIVDVTDKKLKAETGYTGQVLRNNYTIKGVPLKEGQVEIKIYINVDTGMGIGDKMILGNQLKCTVGEVFNHDISADDGTPIDCKFSYRSISARIVNSATLMGTTGMVLEKLTEKVLDMYFK